MTAWIIFFAWLNSLGDNASTGTCMLIFLAWISEIY
jgi:hypothetical protein